MQQPTENQPTQEPTVNQEQAVHQEDMDTDMAETNEQAWTNPGTEAVQQAEPNQAVANQELTQPQRILTPTTYHAECVVTPENATAVLHARLEKASSDFYNTGSATPEDRARLQEAHRNALEAWKVHQETEAALSVRTHQEPAELVAHIKQSTIVPKDLPALQFRGGPMRNANKPVHDSVQSFIDAFEGQLRSHSLLPLNDHWERLFWVCLDNT